MPFTQPANTAHAPLLMARLAPAVTALATIATAILAISAACTVYGCAPSAPAQGTKTPVGAPIAPPLQPLDDTDWSRFRSKRHRLSIPFPQGKTWQIRDRGMSWLVASHPGSHSVLMARSWIESRPVSLQQCEALARKTNAELPEMSTASIIEQIDSSTRFSSAFTSRLVVALASDSAHPNTLAGYTFAFGVAGRNCVAILIKTPGTKEAASTAKDLELVVRIIENTLYLPSIPSSSGPTSLPSPDDVPRASDTP